MPAPDLGLGPEIQEAYESSLHSVGNIDYPSQHFEKELENFEMKIRHEVVEGQPVIEADVKQIIKDARRLMEFAYEEEDRDSRNIIYAAIDYLLNDVDAVPDFSDYDGFDDDRNVLDFFLNSLGLDESFEAAA